MPHVLVGSERNSVAFESGACAYDVVGDKARQVVVARVNGEVVDLSHQLNDGDQPSNLLLLDQKLIQDFLLFLQHDCLNFEEKL